MLSRTATGETCPITVTLLESTSIVNDVTPDFVGVKTLAPSIQKNLEPQA